MLGLISLAEIPRRLSLDFSDFFQKGFGFNTMSGEFVFADGRASTDLLLINGPAAEIRVSGSTDLRLQQYDQRIEVLPKAGGALPVIGAIAGGPVGAAVGRGGPGRAAEAAQAGRAHGVPDQRAVEGAEGGCDREGRRRWSNASPE